VHLPRKREKLLLLEDYHSQIERWLGGNKRALLDGGSALSDPKNRWRTLRRWGTAKGTHKEVAPTARRRSSGAFIKRESTGELRGKRG